MSDQNYFYWFKPYLINCLINCCLQFHSFSCFLDTFSSGTDSIVGIESCKKCPPNTMRFV